MEVTSLTSFRDERSALAPQLKRIPTKDKEDPLVSTDATYPFFLASRLIECTIRVKEPSYFLVGQLDYEVFELEAMRPSRSTAWRGPKKKPTLL